jgi:hypothetical protein
VEGNINPIPLQLNYHEPTYQEGDIVMDWLMINSILSFILVLIIVLPLQKRKRENKKFPKMQFVVSLFAGIGIFVVILSILL